MRGREIVFNQKGRAIRKPLRHYLLSRSRFKNLHSLIFGNIIPKMNRPLTTALYSILKSLVGLMFRNGIAFGDFSKLAKRAYIEVTERELRESGQKTTTSSIAIITGLTRKEVAALRKETSPKLVHTTTHNRATRVISGWISDTDFCDSSGKAKMLNVQGEEGSFEALVSRHSGDIPYRAMLDELVRTDAVQITDTNQVVLLRAAYIPSTGESDKYALLGEDVSLLINTIKHNIVVASDSSVSNGTKNRVSKEKTAMEADSDTPFYQRKVCYDKIPAEFIPAFKQMANEENQSLLVKLNQWLAEHDMDKHPLMTGKAMKVGVGIYYFEDLSGD